MARHSHWHQIRQKKGAEDKKRGKTFTRHAKLIAIAVQKGGRDPEMNPSLRMAIENARADNLPKANIDRAIQRGMGEDKDAAQFSEVMYEGFGPGGVAILIQAVTDNKNRTFQSIRNILMEHGGVMGAAGSIAYLFQQRGIIRVKASDDKESDELKLIDAGAEDLSRTDSEFTVFCLPSKVHEVKKNVEGAGFQVLSAEISFEPKTLVTIEDKNIAQKLLDLVDALEEDEDVSKVSANFDIPESLLS